MWALDHKIAALNAANNLVEKRQKVYNKNCLKHDKYIQQQL